MSIQEIHYEGFKLLRIRKYNKKQRRNLGISDEDVEIIEVASGSVKVGTKFKRILRTSEIVHSEFNKETGYMHFDTANGKRYKVKYRDTGITQYPRSLRLTIDTTGFKPEGWYDPTFPTKDLHDKWLKLLDMQPIS